MSSSLCCLPGRPRWVSSPSMYPAGLFPKPLLPRFFRQLPVTRSIRTGRTTQGGGSVALLHPGSTLTDRSGSKVTTWPPPSLELTRLLLKSYHGNPFDHRSSHDGSKKLFPGLQTSNVLWVIGAKGVSRIGFKEDIGHAAPSDRVRRTLRALISASSSCMRTVYLYLMSSISCRWAAIISASRAFDSRRSSSRFSTRSLRMVNIL